MNLYISAALIQMSKKHTIVTRMPSSFLEKKNNKEDWTFDVIESSRLMTYRGKFYK